MQSDAMKGDSRRTDHKIIKSRDVYNLCDLHSGQAGRCVRFDRILRSFQMTFCGYTVFPEPDDFVRARPELSRSLSLDHVRSGDRQLDSSLTNTVRDFVESGTTRYDPNRGSRNDQAVYGRALSVDRRWIPSFLCGESPPETPPPLPPPPCRRVIHRRTPTHVG